MNRLPHDPEAIPDDGPRGALKEAEDLAWLILEGVVLDSGELAEAS